MKIGGAAGNAAVARLLQDRFRGELVVVEIARQSDSELVALGQLQARSAEDPGGIPPSAVDSVRAIDYLCISSPARQTALCVQRSLQVKMQHGNYRTERRVLRHRLAPS